MDRFWSKVDSSGGPDACWPWTAARTPRSGYGHFSIDGTQRTAHSVALELATGEKANGRKALHRCDNPPCCNPDHLFWGSQSDNMKDMMQKRRHPKPRGEHNGASKLTEDRVRLIKTSTKPSRVLAQELGVCRATVNYIRAGKTWAHV